MSKTDNVSMEEEVWYIYVNEETRGPIGLRDLDVLIRTNEINSRTLGWKNGMNEWKPLNEIEEIKQSIFESSKEMIEIQKKKQTLLAGGSIDGHNLQPQNQESEEEDQMVENKDEDPLAILEVTVENLLKKTFHQNQEGKWGIFDQEKGEWTLQDQQPTERIALMKSNLLSKLKSELFFDQKNRRKNKHSEHEEHLTKQQLEKRQRNRKKTKRMAEKKKEKWYNARINTFIYISGLPFDISEEELKEFVCKAGVLRVDPKTGKEKLKLYKDQNGLPKGDAAVSYAREQSVQIALDMLNERQIREGFVVTIERAKFNQKDEEYIPRESKKQEKIKKILARKLEQKQLTWDEDHIQKGDGLKIVIMKFVFTPGQMADEVQSEEIKKDIEDQVKKIGPVKRLRFFQQHPDGVVQIKFQNDKDAQECISVMNGRFFDGRQILCEYWDGETDFKRDASSIALQEERLMMYADQIEEDIEGKNPERKRQVKLNLDMIHEEYEENDESSRVQQKNQKNQLQNEPGKEEPYENGLSHEKARNQNSQ